MSLRCKFSSLISWTGSLVISKHLCRALPVISGNVQGKRFFLILIFTVLHQNYKRLYFKNHVSHFFLSSIMLRSSVLTKRAAYTRKSGWPVEPTVSHRERDRSRGRPLHIIICEVGALS